MESPTARRTYVSIAWPWDWGWGFDGWKVEVEESVQRRAAIHRPHARTQREAVSPRGAAGEVCHAAAGIGAGTA